MKAVYALVLGSPLMLVGFLFLVRHQRHLQKRERDRVARLQAYALDVGWYIFGPPAPWPVDEAARSERTKLMLARQINGFHVWMVWHQWTERSGDGTATYNFTRYYVWLGLHYPDMRVRRHITFSAMRNPVQGIGTADPEFDKRYLIEPTDRHEPVQVLTPAIRQVMAAGQARDWQIRAGTLIHSYPDAARLETLEHRAGGIANFAGLLTQRPG